MNLPIFRGRTLPEMGSRTRLPILLMLMFLLFSVQVVNAADLYWVGGSGNWNDLNHWSLSSGNGSGLLSPSIPQAHDHVIFDANSGFIATKKEVFINLEANCRDLTVKGALFAPVFNGIRLNIYGSADFQSGTVLNNSIYFRGTGIEQISFNEGSTGTAAFYFTGTGTYILSGKLESNGGIYFLQGNLDLGSSQITTGFFDENGCCGSVPFSPANNRSLNLGSSTITLNGRNSQSDSNSPTWAYTGKTLIGGSSSIKINTSVADGYGVRFIAGDSHQYHYVVFANPDRGAKNSTPYQWYQIDQGKCSFHKLSFASDGYIASNITVDTLVLAKSKRYYLYGQQTFSDIQNQTDSCDPFWSITGIGGQQAILRLKNPIGLINAKLSFLKVLDDRMTVKNGVDAGNNEGITFSTLSKNLYWIGGGGSWHDTNHWTTNPDGKPSAGCLPSRNDNVFFGAYSGRISIENPVSINDDDAECLSITWDGVTGFPAFVSAKPQYALSIFGSSTWQQHMVYRISNTRYLGMQNHLIRSNGVLTHGDTHFESSGKCILADAFVSDGDLLFLSGTFVTNGHNVVVKNFGYNSRGSGKRILDISNSEISVSGNWSYMNFGGPSIEVSAANSTIRMLEKNALFRYNSGLIYQNLIFENKEGVAALQAEMYSTRQPCYFDSLLFKGNARINVLGSPTPLYIKHLTLASGGKYTLGTNMPVSTEDILVGSECNGMGILCSEAAGTQANLMLLKNLSLPRFQVSDLNCSDQQLIVAGGIDGGNNTNVRIEAATAKNLYWIGGSGQWSDLAHWSYDSSGNTTGVTCLPTYLDHVHFNSFSGQNFNVILDIPAVCGDMIWDALADSHPGISGNSLTISGSLTLQRGMNFDVERVEFVGNGVKAVTTNGVALGYSGKNYSDRGIFFNGYGGSWKLIDSLKAKNIGLINGSLFTNGKMVEAENWVSRWTNDQKLTKLILDKSQLNISGYWDASGVDSLDAGNSSITISGKMPSDNESGNGLYINFFRSGPGHVYHNVRFSNPSTEAKVICSNTKKGYTFKNALFAGSVSFNSSNIMQSLTTGGNVHLWSGSTQQVDQWKTISDCQQWDLDNNCISPGDGCLLTQKAKLVSSYPIALNNVRLSGIEISGPDEHTAFGTDMGNNRGWNFLRVRGRTLYWIGGSGNYSDPAHWSTNNDGTPSGNYCSPNQNDNVVFNQYSGENISISVQGLAECRDMNWMDAPGKPVLNGLIDCYGSLILQPSLTHNGGINFLSADSEIIQTHSAVVARNSDVNFSGGGRYLLLDDFNTDSHLNITKGELNTNSKTVRALSLNGIESATQNAGTISLVLGASKIFLSYYSGGWQYTATRLDAGNSHIYLVGNANIFRAKDGAKYHTITFDTTPNNLHEIFGSFTVDSMIFARKNSSYQLESFKTVTVNKQLTMSGNPCGTVSVRASMPDKQFNFQVLGGDTTYNYITVSQINVTGRKLLLLGEGVDLGGNSNIRFSLKPDKGIGLLGPDKTICAGQFPIRLSAQSFFPDQDTRIIWRELYNQQLLGHALELTIDHAGTYAITVAYQEGCIVSDTITISADTVAAFSKSIKTTQPGCTQASGLIQLPAGPTYSVDGAEFSDKLFYQLPTGLHFILAKSAHGCISDTARVIINPQRVKPKASIRYALVETKATGHLDVLLEGTKGGVFSASPEGLAIDSLTGTIDLSSSEPGKNYVITYAAGSGDCIAKDSTILRLIPTPTTIHYPLLDYCAIGSVPVRTEGINEGVYKASPPGLAIDLHSGLVNLGKSEAGQYKVSYSYNDGSLKLNADTYIKINPLPVVSIYSNKKTIIEGESLPLSASGGSNYQWIGENILSAADESSITVRPIRKTNYRVIATNKEGCSQAEEVTIDVRKPLIPIPNNVITPNGDGKNDTWAIANIDDYPNNTVKIFDRAGRLIYFKKSYRNQWDGRINGVLLNEDAYIFVLDLGNGTALLRGTVSIIHDNKTNSKP